MKTITINEPDGPEVLRLEEVETPETPGAGELPIRVEITSIKHADTAAEQGKTFGPHRGTFPVTPRFKVTGTVAALGDGLGW